MDIKDLKKLIISKYPNVNKDNLELFNELSLYLQSIEYKSKKQFNSYIGLFFKERRGNKGVSKISPSYWISLGWCEDEANRLVSKLQRSRSHLTKEYWINKGFNDDEAILKVAEVQSSNSRKKYLKYTKDELSQQSVWSKSYWLNKGLTDEEAQYEVSKRNYAHREFWKSDEEYETVKKIIGKKTSNFIKENPELYKNFFGSISKEEINFFNFISTKLPNILHKEFIVNIKTSEELEAGIVKFDGYLKTDDNIILIEYDGLYWHNQSYDEIKDSIVLNIRPDVIGIIRVSCEYFKQNKITIIKKLNNAINQIKSKECNRIKLY